jgi:hypothetical protein
LLEIAGFSYGSKPALRFVVDKEDSITLLTAAAEIKLPSCAQQVYLQNQGGSWTELVSEPTACAAELVVISHSSNASEILGAELTDPVAAGKLLGYPECCAQSVTILSSIARDWPLKLLSGLPSGSFVNARLNRFAAEWGGTSLIGELFPCCLECRAAAAYSQSLYDAACALGLTRLAAAALSDSLVPVHLGKDGVISPVDKSRDPSIEFFW